MHPMKTCSKGKHPLRNLLVRGKGARNLDNSRRRRSGRKSPSKNRGGDGSDNSSMVQKRSSGSSWSSTGTGTGTSSLGSNHRAYSDSIHQCSTCSSSFEDYDSFHHRRYADDSNDYRDDILDAEVSRCNFSNNDDCTFDYDYTKQQHERPTFDYDYAPQAGHDTYNHPSSRQQPQTLPTLQQHLAKKQEDSQYPTMAPLKLNEESWMNNEVLDSAHVMEYSQQESRQKPPLIDEKAQTHPPQFAAATKPSERYASRKNSIVNMDPSLIDDTIRGTQEGVLDMKVLQEMGLRTSSRKPLPDWVNDILGAPRDGIDPKVLKELVASTTTVDNDTSSWDSAETSRGFKSDTEQAQGDWVARKPRKDAEREELKSDDDYSIMASAPKRSFAADESAIIDRQQPLEHVTKQQIYDEQNKGLLSVVAHDTRGPIPPTNDILESPFSSIVESQFSSIVESPQVSTVAKDTRGPIPDAAILDCALSASSDNKGVGSVSSSSYDVKKDSTNNMPSVLRTSHKEGKSMGRSSFKKDGETSCASRTSHNEGGSICSSSYGSKKDSSYEKGGDSVSKKGDETANMSKTSPSSYSYSYSDRKPPPPINLSPTSTIPQSSSQNQSLDWYFMGRSWSTIIDYPSDEETHMRDMPLPPSLRRLSSYSFGEDRKMSPVTFTKPSEEEPSTGMSLQPPPLRRLSSSSSFSFDDDQDSMSHVARTKPSLGFLSWSPVHPFCSGKDDIQAAAMKMRQDVLEAMLTELKSEIHQTRDKEQKKPFHPIDI